MSEQPKDALQIKQLPSASPSRTPRPPGSVSTTTTPASAGNTARSKPEAPKA